MRFKSRKYKNIARIIRLCCITGAMFAYSSTAYATIAVGHNSLPTGGNFLHGGNNNGIVTNGSVMDVTQTGANAVIEWQDFSIGTNATVNFHSSVFSKADSGNKTAEFNVLNYVNSGAVSQIYGNLNAVYKDKTTGFNVSGNVYLVNTAGALISKSAEINVGSLYVSNKSMKPNELNAFATGGTNPVINGTVTSAELMNLGHIKANKVTFDGDRVVLDLDYIKKNMKPKKIKRKK